MHIIHGTWIPDDAHEFIQSGAFYLWVETDTPPGRSKRRADAVHPRHLMHKDLAAFLMEKLGLREFVSGSLEHSLCMKSFLLPTAAGKPTPSFELLRYVDEEEPLEFELAPWQVSCYQAPDIITALNDIHFIALNAAEDFQLGADLFFWHQYSQALKSIIAKDQYIPALKYREIMSTSGKGKRAKNTTSFEIHHGWELLSDTYEMTIESYVAAMPGVCIAGLNGLGDGAALFDEESLLRHFSECLLHNIVTGTPFTGKFDQQIEGTILYKCVYPYRPALSYASDNKLEDYKHWLTWRANLTRAHTEAGFTLCFRLEEAPASDIDNWQLHFLVAARHDPSFKLSLDEYWRLKPKARAEAARNFGQNFEKNLLLALGYAARIYPTIWAGMATDQPVGCHLKLDEAFAFLKESAWVLGDAGYTVIVPAWWTPEGRRRTKVRLKTSLRSPKGGTTATSG
ncbi:MAG TPA: SNF2 helicase-associated domain-containing protein, partial [Ktedonobacteraceae bacterium]